MVALASATGRVGSGRTVAYTKLPRIATSSQTNLLKSHLKALRIQAIQAAHLMTGETIPRFYPNLFQKAQSYTFGFVNALLEGLQHP
jgi:hypothetical protein